MDLTYIMEYRFRSSADGAVWTDTSYDYSYWKRYLRTFDKVNIVARVLPEPPLQNWRKVDGAGVTVTPVPHYLGPAEYCLRAKEIHATIRSALQLQTAVILRTPSQLCIAASMLLRQKGIPYGVEVVGDPFEALGVTEHPLRSFFQWWYARHQRLQCTHAATACFVSRQLRLKYPPGPETSFIDCSDVILSADAFRGSPRRWENRSPARLVTVATLSQVYKGIDRLLKAMAQCAAAGYLLQLTIVGDGKYRSYLERMAMNLKLSTQVRFTGSLLSGPPVQAELDAADLFVLPSLTEGTPRALLEAMARGLPCLASAVGGIPSILAAEDLVPPGNVAALASKICGVLDHPARLQEMSRRNLLTAANYRYEVLDPCWKDLQEQLLAKTAAFLERKASHSAPIGDYAPNVLERSGDLHG